MLPESDRSTCRRICPVAALVVAVLALGLCGAQTAHAADGAKVCKAATILREGGHPQAARERVVQEMGNSVDPCLTREEAKDAAAIDGAQALASSAKSKLATKPRQARKLVAAALKLDADNAEAKRLEKALPAESFVERLKDHWDALLDGTLVPLRDLAIPFFYVLAALVVLARLASAAPRRWPRTSDADRRGYWYRGLSAVTAAAALLTIGLGEANHWSHHLEALRIAVPVLGAALAAVGVFKLAAAMATRLRLNIEVRDEGGKPSENATGQVAALLGELGAAPPSGLEVPRGADVIALAGTPIASTPEGKIVSAVLHAWQLVFGITPWRVEIDVRNADVHAIVITRNGHTVASMVVDRARLGLYTPIVEEGDKADDTPRRPDLFRFGAAAILTTLAARYEGFDGLLGVKDWRSLGLHYVATTDYLGKANVNAHRKALVQAVDFDPRNVPARVALRNSQDRDSTEEAVRVQYIDWLQKTIESIADTTGAFALRLRLRLTLLAVACNQAVGSVGEEAVIAQGDALFEELKDPEEGSNALAESMKPSAAAAYLSLGGNTHAVQATKWLGGGSGLSPKGDYAYACIYARGLPGPPLPPAGQLHPSPPDVTVAVEHLRRASLDDELTAWMPDDPWLRDLRKTPEYRAQFLEAPRTDFLVLDPLKPHAEKLRAGGIQTADELAAMAVWELARYLGVDHHVARRLLHLALLATAIASTALRAFNVELADALLGQKLDSLVKLERRVEDGRIRGVARALLDSIGKRCQDVPKRRELLEWLASLVPG